MSKSDKSDDENKAELGNGIYQVKVWGQQCYYK